MIGCGWERGGNLPLEFGGNGAPSGKEAVGLSCPGDHPVGEVGGAAALYFHSRSFAPSRQLLHLFPGDVVLECAEVDHSPDLFEIGFDHTPCLALVQIEQVVDEEQEDYPGGVLLFQNLREQDVFLIGRITADPSVDDIDVGTPAELCADDFVTEELVALHE